MSFYPSVMGNLSSVTEKNCYLLHLDFRDFTDIMLIEIQKTTDPASSFYGEFGIENLVNVMMDLFVAGSETTSTTLTWAMLYMIRYPKVIKIKNPSLPYYWTHIQCKIFSNIESFYGRPLM